MNNWLNPNIGDLPLSEVNNAVLKTRRCEDVGRRSVSKDTSTTTSQVVKMVVASAVDERRRRNLSTKVEPRVHRHACGREGEAEHAVLLIRNDDGLGTWKKERERMVFILCGAAGLEDRRGTWYRDRQAHLSRFLDHHRQTESSSLQGRTTAQDSERAFVRLTFIQRLPLCSREFVGERKTGFLFCTRNGKATLAHRTSSAAICTRH